MKNIFSFLGIFWFVLLTNSYVLLAQTTLRFSDETLRDIPQIWSVQIQQMNTSTQTVYLLATIREKNAGEIYKARSNEFTLEPGITTTNENTMQPLNVLLNRLEYNSDLPARK
jgi:hypothetical protein